LLVLAEIFVEYTNKTSKRENKFFFIK